MSVLGVLFLAHYWNSWSFDTGTYKINRKMDKKIIKVKAFIGLPDRLCVRVEVLASATMSEVKERVEAELQWERGPVVSIWRLATKPSDPRCIVILDSDDPLVAFDPASHSYNSKVLNEIKNAADFKNGWCYLARPAPTTIDIPSDESDASSSEEETELSSDTGLSPVQA